LPGALALGDPPQHFPLALGEHGQRMHAPCVSPARGLHHGVKNLTACGDHVESVSDLIDVLILAQEARYADLPGPRRSLRVGHG